MINCKEVRDCWINGVFISPVVINSMQDVRIDVYNIENGKLVIIRKGTTVFKQKTKKEKEKIYETILEAYKHYYNKL